MVEQTHSMLSWLGALIGLWVVGSLIALSFWVILVEATRFVDQRRYAAKQRRLKLWRDLYRMEKEVEADQPQLDINTLNEIREMNHLRYLVETNLQDELIIKRAKEYGDGLDGTTEGR